MGIDLDPTQRGTNNRQYERYLRGKSSGLYSTSGKLGRRISPPLASLKEYVASAGESPSSTSLNGKSHTDQPRISEMVQIAAFPPELTTFTRPLECDVLEKNDQPKWSLRGSLGKRTQVPQMVSNASTRRIEVADTMAASVQSELLRNNATEIKDNSFEKRIAASMRELTAETLTSMNAYSLIKKAVLSPLNKLASAGKISHDERRQSYEQNMAAMLDLHNIIQTPDNQMRLNKYKQFHEQWGEKGQQIEKLLDGVMPKIRKIQAEQADVVRQWGPKKIEYKLKQAGHWLHKLPSDDRKLLEGAAGFSPSDIKTRLAERAYQYGISIPLTFATSFAIDGIAAVAGKLGDQIGMVPTTNPAEVALLTLLAYGGLATGYKANIDQNWRSLNEDVIPSTNALSQAIYDRTHKYLPTAAGFMAYEGVKEIPWLLLLLAGKISPSFFTGATWGATAYTHTEAGVKKSLISFIENNRFKNDHFRDESHMAAKSLKAHRRKINLVPHHRKHV